MITKVDANVDFIAVEHAMLDFWQRNAIFQKLVQRNSAGPLWRFIDGPITANNPMGVHHAWGRTYKDIFHRYKAMNGFHTRYQNGFDCQGLWVEVEVEKQLNFKSKTDIETYGIEHFVNQCKERVRKYSRIQTEQSIRLGYWMDWEHSYYTMSDENNYTIWLFLKKCHERGWIYRGHDVMPWCTRCGAALSEHEIATEGYKELTHTGLTVRFPIHDRDHEYLLVWTTTPWTLTSNTAAAVHPDKYYLRVRQEESVYYIIEGRHHEVLRGGFAIEGRFQGKEMLGWTYRGPFDELPAQCDVRHVVIPWEEISETEGTGIVHIAPGCGQEDHELGRQYHLTTIAPLDEFGNYIAGFGWLTGRNVSEVTRDIFRDLEQKGIKYRIDPYTHRYPVCWRHGTELVFRLVDEWFIAMDEVRQDMMDVTRQIRWIPDYGLEHELDWLRNMHDWMISKKRYWGLALPIYVCPACNHLMVIGGKEELQRRAVSGWELFEGHSPHRPWVDYVKIACDQCGAEVSRIPDVGNPWLDAGIVPYSTLHYTTDRSYWEKWFPADFISESLPGQFRNWFYSLLAMSTVLEKQPPFKTILGYALVKDEKGQDMHKSAGNAIWFDDAAEKMGVDVMRWLYADHNPFINLNFGYNVAKEVRKQLITLWNSYSFFATYAELDGYSPEQHPVTCSELADLDRWLISRLHTLYLGVRSELDDYMTGRAMKYIDDFLEDLSNWYIRRSRRRFWKSENDQDKWGAYATLYAALKGLILVLAPVIPFVTDHIYQNLVRGVEPQAPESIHLCRYPIPDETLIDERLTRRIDTVIKLVSLGRAARNKANLKVRQPLARMWVVLPDESLTTEIADLSDQIVEELNIKAIEFCRSDADFITLRLKPNLKLLAEKYPEHMAALQTVFKQTDTDPFLAEVQAGRRVTISAGDAQLRLAPEDWIIERQERPGFAGVAEAGLSVVIATEITPELMQEGMVRDIVRHVQTMRKEAGFQVEDRISVHLQATTEIAAAIAVFRDYFMNETLAQFYSEERGAGEFEKTINIRGNDIHIAISRVK